jgi:hypothetical protein
MQTGQPNLLRFASHGGKTAGDIAGLHEATFHNLKFALPHPTAWEIGADEAAGLRYGGGCAGAGAMAK